jgi:membrane-bound inhibitor of C-type lysozyme
MTPLRFGLFALAVTHPSIGACAKAQPAHKSAALLITLSGQDQVVRHHVRYTCDANATKLNLPSGIFTVEYIAAGGNGLAIVPVGGERIIFSRVLSASGERFAAGVNEWGDKGSEAWLSDIRAGAGSSTCHEVR